MSSVSSERTVKLCRLHPNQQRIRNEARRFNVLNSGRRWGKTVVGIDLVIDTALDGFPAGWFAPEYKLLREAWREIKWTLHDAIRTCSDTERRIELVTDGIIEAWAFDRNPNAGRSRKYKRIVVDEAAHCQNLEEVWTKGIRPTLTDYQGDAWFLSSPNGQNFFHKLYERGQSSKGHWKSWTQTSYDNPFLLKSEIDAAKEELPDWVFDQEYLAKFLREAFGQLLLDWWVARLTDPAIEATCRELRERGKGGRKRLAADLALGTGRDRTIILVRDNLGVLDYHESSYTGIPAAAKLMADFARQWGIDSENLVYDAGGPGRDLPKYLEQYRIEAVPYNGSASGGDKFKNKRSKVAWRMRQRLDPERPEIKDVPDEKVSIWKPKPERETKPQPPFSIPARFLSDEGREELLQLRYEMKGPKIALELKDDFMKRLGRSPDYADALMMTFNTNEV